ncbi:DUF6356 family protein [Yoonia sp. I 8.24]|uniref:DUF6356 family protein n=1 Tax=Yoonia sp. I 8.24 TaxID=1537229 RepID=UPI001EDFB3FC|nr:DUF6356 family protein [Yoonia sp. I 8.24]MCG3269446.1 hypothetical protein [Yoonia sp. I 8.24]
MSDTSPTPARRSLIATLFLDHPDTVNETYFTHMRFALSFGFWLAVAAIAALLHAFIPAVCETTASRIVKRLQDRIDGRHAG